MILSIESSCDDSSLALTKINNYELVFHEKISQEIAHSSYGGVVPELAARLHTSALPKILEKAAAHLKDAKAIAVTNEPGLSVSLLEGVTMAKALSIALNVPILPINHLKGHIYSLFIEREERLPLGVLLVSGGHTQILHAKNYDDIRILASTLDDSFGESFDKTAKMLSLGYPGGAVIEEYAKKGEKRFGFTIPMQRSKNIAFSYSGLKNQVRLAIQKLRGNISQQDMCDIAASFQDAAISHVLKQCEKIFKQNIFTEFAIVGGAGANQTLREKMRILCEHYGIKLHLPPLEFCSDNAAMIGRAGIEAYKLKRFVSPHEIKINPKSSSNQLYRSK
ncbi:MAG: tRNA (adenosine(37)-N6)-threonylcarbamoyltransferase complex transferase subunit TsaD [Campylobacteraceae bacterium]|jgi:N6-L-threonylcarbamoyladenine synthase|nr:tRNA (adenosine(37)-N6)-threonylcarbamoyltransferase complex transferase subunit TsaD [Campylobacteraceae bacterium]